MKTYTKICPVCGKEFTTKAVNQKFCSRNCWHENWNKTYTKICPYCGKEFTAGTKDQKFCSVSCAANSYKKFYKKICPRCGKEFITRRKDQKFCSVGCVNNGKHYLYKKTCPVCGKEFTTENRRQIHCFDCQNVRLRFSRRKKVSDESNSTQKKSLDQWIEEAALCKMSYGAYRCAIERLGKTFDELKKIP